MSRKKILSLLILVPAVACLGVFIVKKSSTGEVVFQVDDNVSGFVLDNHLYDKNNKNFKLEKGLHTVKAVGPLVSATQQTFEVRPFKKQTVELRSKSLEASELAKELFGASDIFTIGSVKMTSDKSWLIISVVIKDGEGDGDTFIYNFNGQGWEEYASGTNFDLDGVSDESLPREVSDIIQGRQNQ
ncbi:hypothetical protein IPO96_01915 [Candidatus Saccharibacteria bacterium]|nr:MAG: hypothetical protein IPO96_01915 [Candidatus Saccharibacteria bacterium]